MSSQQPSHAGVAVVTIIGAFTVIITALVTRQNLSEWLIVLVTGSVGSVTGFYFGASAAAGPLSMAHNTISKLAALLNPPPHTPPAPDTAPALDTIKE